MSRPGKLRGNYYDARDELVKYAEKEARMVAEVIDDGFPLRVRFIPCAQEISRCSFDAETGEMNDLTISVGTSTEVRSTMRFAIPAKKLKKLISLAEKLGGIYYLLFREEADP